MELTTPTMTIPGARRFIQAISTVAGLVASIGLIHAWYRRRVFKEKREALNRKRRDQGNHECEVLGNLLPIAMESQASWGSCQKNPGHPTFIQASEFSLRHLPAGYQDAKVLDLVQNVAARTVRLRVNYTSSKRPEDFPFHESRGKRILHLGSGWVRDVIARTGLCRCWSCIDKNKEVGTRWWLIKINTACHVVFDTDEAKETFVDVFHDQEIDSPYYRPSGRKTLMGLKVIAKSDDQDLCRFYCATHDEGLARELKGRVQQWKELTRLMGVSFGHEHHAPIQLHAPAKQLEPLKHPTTQIVGMSYEHEHHAPSQVHAPMKQLEPLKHPTTNNIMMDESQWQESHAPIVIVASHPHGKAKRITVGQWERNTEENEIGESALLYKTDTCSGSSGAPVIMLMKREGDGAPCFIPTEFPHSGIFGAGLNQSAVGGVYH